MPRIDGKRRKGAPANSPKKRQNSLIFGFIFFGLGGVFLWVFFGYPAWKSYQASEWEQVEAVVQDSFVKSHQSDDGTTYSIQISYTYEIDGTTYKSDRYHFILGSSSGYSSKQKVVDQYPKGKTITCLVNPEDPNEAVIKRGLGKAWWFAPFPLIFMLVGMAVMFPALFRRPANKKTNRYNKSYSQ